MTPAVDAWLTRFAAGAGTLFVWRVTPTGFLCALLTVPDADGGAQRVCPLSAQATLDTGHSYAFHEALQAGLQQGLRLMDCHAIIEAADGRAHADPAMVTRLRRICRVNYA